MNEVGETMDYGPQIMTGINELRREQGEMRDTQTEMLQRLTRVEMSTPTQPCQYLKGHIERHKMREELKKEHDTAVKIPVQDTTEWASVAKKILIGAVIIGGIIGGAVKAIWSSYL